MHTVEQAVALAREIERRPQIELAALMAYEGQIAGVGDRPPGRRLRGAAIRFMQRRSAAELAERRAAIVAAIRELAELPIVNGGGTGSLELTGAEDAVTEVAAGSGFYAPGPLRPLQPLLAHPGGRLCAADRAQADAGGRDRARRRLPRLGRRRPGPAAGPWLPAGLRLDPEEGAGEVQTPLLGPAAAQLSIGDRVYLRHAKAGELCERFDLLHLVEGGAIVDVVPTYRGEGRAFL